MTRSGHQDRVFQVQVTHVGVMLAVFLVQVTRVGVMQTVFFRYKLHALGSCRPCFSGTNYLRWGHTDRVFRVQATRVGVFLFFLFFFRYKLHALGARRLPGFR